ncbi:MAG: FAD-binding oxidoreductase [Parvibaculum sp.]|uniref:FAD-binding oxidoreductase n=1 Tax=Parvibaculum sp. TaxID=2024848 RepID=UPI003C749056
MKAVVGPSGFIDAADDMAPYLVERRDLYKGRAAAVLRPASTAEVSALMKIAHDTETRIVPQGGNTGLVGGQVPFETGEEVVLSLARMNRVIALDAENNTLTVEAGVTLAAAQDAAQAAGRLFPLSLASEGSCEIGGNLSTNAGGTAVLRYGNARDLVLGLEVVLADGRVWNGMRGLRKDNTGYDLKQIFLGAEGTLGVITGAVLKLFPRPRAVETSFVAVPDVEAAVSLLRLADEATGGLVTGFELMPRIGIEFVTRHLPGASDPLAAPSPWYVLIELASGGEGDALSQALEAMLETAMEKGLVTDAAIAQSGAQRAEFWRLRESMSDVQRLEGGSIKHDVSVPVSAVAGFIARASRAVEKALPGIRPVPFGHVGDGNIHFNLSQPEGMDKLAYLARWDEMSAIVHGIVREYGGSISAEHGVGRMKRDEIAATKSPVEIELMRTLKRALDPKNILNPGKVVSLD